MTPVEGDDSPAARLALAFAHALAKRDFQAAYRMLVPSQRDDLSADELKGRYEQMVSYWTAPPDRIKLATVVEDWPDQSGPGLVASRTQAAAC
jgi:hypothetical protein